MVAPFIGEIRMFSGTFAPKGWALCDGQILNVRDNPELFAQLGTAYGGDGRATFGLPDLRGRLPMHAGSGLGLTSRTVGEKGGSETETLSSNQVPAHTHTWQATSEQGDQSRPEGNLLAGNTAAIYATGTTPTANMATDMIVATGNASPTSRNNLMPFAVINFIIATSGIRPTQT